MKKRAYVMAAALAGLVMSAAPAQAQPASSSGTVVRAQIDMVAGGIDRAQAARAGNIVEVHGGTAVLRDGRTSAVLAQVPASRVYNSRSAVRAAAKAAPFVASTSGVSPQTVVYGSCGASYLYMRDGGSNDNDFEFSTGFDLNRSAYDFDWYVYFDGPNGFGTSFRDSGPMWPDEHWTSGWKSEYSGADGLHHGVVKDGVAFAVNGSVCYTGHPTSSAWAS